MRVRESGVRSWRYALRLPYVDQWNEYRRIWIMSLGGQTAWINVDMDENKSWMREEEERRSKLEVARVGLGWYG